MATLWMGLTAGWLLRRRVPDPLWVGALTGCIAFCLLPGAVRLCSPTVVLLGWLLGTILGEMLPCDPLLLHLFSLALCQSALPVPLAAYAVVLGCRERKKILILLAPLCYIIGAWLRLPSRIGGVLLVISAAMLLQRQSMLARGLAVGWAVTAL